jgi:hypothetical protein
MTRTRVFAPKIANMQKCMEDVVAERISKKRSLTEGWLSVRQVRDATGLGHATVMERFENASRDGLRVARLESGEWRLHRDDLAKLPRRYESKGAPRSKVESLEREVQELRSRLRALEAALARA